MSLDIAIQSAIFYYLACSPCITFSKQYKAKRQARKIEKERKKHPDHVGYQQPVPMMTNPFWNEEIENGPSLPRTKNGTTVKILSNRPGEGRPNAEAVAPLSSSRSLGPSPPASGDPRPSGEEWNTRPFQREDEEIWGIHVKPITRYSSRSTDADTSSFSDGQPESSQHVRLGHRLVDAVVRAGESAGRFIEAAKSPLMGRGKVSDDDTSSVYRPHLVIPPVNDYHPPVVSYLISNADDRSWMLQPPPLAAVMVPASQNPSRSSSLGSHSSHRPIPSPPLERLVHERMLSSKDFSANGTGTEFCAEAQRYSNLRRDARWTSGHGSVMGKVVHARSHFHTRARSLSLDDAEEEVVEEIHIHRCRRRHHSHRTKHRMCTTEEKEEPPTPTKSKANGTTKHGHATPGLAAKEMESKIERSIISEKPVEGTDTGLSDEGKVLTVAAEPTETRPTQEKHWNSSQEKSAGVLASEDVVPGRDDGDSGVGQEKDHSTSLSEKLALKNDANPGRTAKVMDADKKAVLKAELPQFGQMVPPSS